MNTLTKEWLQNTITSIESARDEIPFGLDEDQNNMLTALKIALASLAAVSDERAAYELFMEKRFGESVDRRREKNGDREYMAWDMALGWIIWCHRAAMLQGKAAKQSSSIKTSDCAGQGEDIKQASSNEPVSQPYKLPAEVRDAINRLLDSDGSRGTFSAFRCADAREELERLLAAEPVSQRDELPANVIDALEKALQAMSFMGDTLNTLDAVCEEDVEYVTPAFEAVREVLEGNSPAIPDGWVAVPVEPTIAILDEFDSIIDYGAEDSKDAWSRLLAAAWIKSLPAAPRQEVK